MKKIIFTLFILMAFKFADAQCVSSFTAETNTVNTQVFFHNTSTTGYGAAFWDFGDGTFSNDTAATVNKNYAAAGFYIVKLTVICPFDFHATHDTLIAVGNVSNLCNARFTYSVMNNEVVFTDVSHGNPDGLLWDFGDGTTDNNNTSSPTHTYNNPGFYNVRLSIFNSTSYCMDMFHRVISVGTNNMDCRADFNFFSHHDWTSVKFFDNSIGGDLTHWRWNFGNGDSSNLPNPKTTYAYPGFYNVCLSVWDDAHTCFNTNCKTIPYKTDSNSCNAFFNYFVNHATKTVTFHDYSTGKPTNWHWNFGNGDTGNSPTPIVTYADNGFYLVHLRASNAYGTSDYVRLINVNMGNNPGLKCNFAYFINNQFDTKTATPVDFKGTSLGDPSEVIWHFGDGTDDDSTSYFPYHLYADTGVYQVSVTVSNHNTNQTDTYTKLIHVFDVGVNELPTTKVSISTSPNPFSTSTNITYFIPKSTNVSLVIYDLIGNKKAVLVNRSQQQGIYTYVWERKFLSNGLYLLEFKTSTGTIVKKLTIIE